MPAGPPIEVTVMELTLPIGAWRLPRGGRRPLRRARGRQLALALGTLLLHGLAVLMVLVSTRTLELPVRRGAAGTFDQGPREAVATTAYFIESAAPAPGEIVSIERPAIEWFVPPAPASLSAPALEDLQRLATVDEAAVAASGMDETERLRGIYRAQLEARIERAWEKPALMDAGLLYSCRVTLTALDGPSGPAIDLSACAGSEALHHSLETAIRRALPLPAPPSALALPRTLTLEFATH